MKKYQQNYALPAMLLALGLVLIGVSVARADWPTGGGQLVLYNICTEETGCFSQPMCAGCSGGDPAWRDCSGTTYTSCKQLVRHAWGVCSGTSGEAPYLCYDNVYCAQIGTYALANCPGAPACTWYVSISKPNKKVCDLG